MEKADWTHVALLRGINIGKRQVPMARLAQLLGKNGFGNAKTLLASGNAVFSAGEKNPAKLRTRLEALLEKEFGFPIPAIIRSREEIIGLVKRNPFKNIKMTPHTQLYVTFLGVEPPKDAAAGKPAFAKIDHAWVEEKELFFVLDARKIRTPDAMTAAVKKYGKDLTTRNWNTVLKIAAL